jgi:hypothetical protein
LAEPVLWGSTCCGSGWRREACGKQKLYEFIPIKLLAATGSNAPGNYAGHSKVSHQITDPLLPQAAPVLHDAAALDTTVDMLDPQPTLVQRLVGQWLLQGQLPPRGFFVGIRICTWGSVNARKPRAYNNRLPAGSG